jgi:hypothetical protein
VHCTKDCSSNKSKANLDIFIIENKFIIASSQQVGICKFPMPLHTLNDVETWNLVWIEFGFMLKLGT